MTSTAEPMEQDQATTPTLAVTARRGDAGDVPDVAAMLARSYSGCAGWRFWLPPRTPRRQERMTRFFRGLIETAYLDREREFVTTDDRAGAILCDPPGKWQMSARQTLRMAVVMAPVFGRRWPLAARGLSAFDSWHPPEPHYYLSVLGVEPARRRDRIAELLVVPRLERCDREGMPAYLETARPGSRDFYARLGFEVLDERALPGGGPPAWRMLREPRR